MKRTSIVFGIKPILLVLALALGFVLAACGNDSGGYDPPVTSVTTKLPAAFVGGKPALNFVKVFEKRLLNQSTAINDDTRIVVIHDTSINDIMPTDTIKAVKAVYNRGGVIVIIEPTFAKSNILTDALNHFSALSNEGTDRHSYDIYAFNNKNAHCFLGDIHPETPRDTIVVDAEGNSSTIPGTNDDLTDEEYGNIIDPFIEWINNNGAGAASRVARAAGDSGYTDITKVFDQYPITQLFPVTVSGDFHYHGKLDMVIYGSATHTASISVNTTVYPLHAFDDQAAPGDYYVMHQEVTMPNKSWYDGIKNYNPGYGSADVCAFFMYKFSITNTLSGGDAAFVSQAAPPTTASSTAYTSGVSWTLGGSVTGGTMNGKPNLTGTFNTGVTYNNTQTRSEADVAIASRVNVGTAAWDANFQNLHAVKNVTNEPPLSSRATYVLLTDWIWRVAEATDDMTNGYTMTINLNGTTWGSSTAATTETRQEDYVTATVTPSIANMTAAVPPPYREPTSALNVVHDGAGYVNSIDIWETGDNGALIYSLPLTLATNAEKNVWLVLGSYKVRVRIGDTYYYSARDVTLEERGTTVNINTANSADFTSQPQSSIW
jgi:hypothetical protein